MSPYTTNTEIAYSGGGDIRICFSGVNPGNNINLDVYSSDLGTDRWVDSPVNFYNRTSISSPMICSDKIDARPFVDGSKAEFYIKGTADSPDTVRIIIED